MTLYLRASKLKHLKSVNSEDAVTWNVFRSLRQIAPGCWIPDLWRRAFDSVAVPTDLQACVELCRSIAPPLGLLADGDEGDSEIDVVIEPPSWVWFIEAKYRSDISTGTRTRPDRDQVLRNLDVGSHHAGVRRYYFSLLVSSEKASPVGIQRVNEYRNLEVPRTRLRQHRPDGLQNLLGVGSLTWGALCDVLAGAASTAAREDERAYASRALNWLHDRGLPGR